MVFGEGPALIDRQKLNNFILKAIISIWEFVYTQKSMLINYNFQMSKKIWEEIQTKLPVSNSEADVKKRNDYWKDFDVNNNGYLSLAEVEKGIKDVIKLPEMFLLKPVITRAFSVAKTAVVSQSQKGDSFVSKDEFQHLLFYLKQYYQYWIVFDEVDTNKDRKISEVELKKALSALAGHGVKVIDLRNAFTQIDSDQGGYILFDEFCNWAIRKHIQLHR